MQLTLLRFVFATRPGWPQRGVLTPPFHLAAATRVATRALRARSRSARSQNLKLGMIAAAARRNTTKTVSGQAQPGLTIFVQPDKCSDAGFGDFFEGLAAFGIVAGAIKVSHD